MNRFRQFVILVSVLCAIAGCAGTNVDLRASQIAPAEKPGDGISGIYQLVAVNGVRIPGKITHDGVALEIEKGVFAIDADGGITSETVFIPPGADRVTRRVKASYTRDDNELLMQWEGAGTTRGSVESDLFVMNNRGMILVYSRSGDIDPLVDLAQLGRCEPSVEISEPSAGVFEAFESDLLAGADCHGNSIGYFTFRDSSDTRVEISTTSEHPSRPGEAFNNRVLQMDLKVKGWAGVIHNFENTDMDTWAPQNWGAFESFSFWIYGNNSGSSMFIDILNNRKPGSTYDDAERFTYEFSDDFSGWRKITVPFHDMLRKEIGNRAPDDGFNRHEVNGWGLGATRTKRALTFYLDDFELIP